MRKRIFQLLAIAAALTWSTLASAQANFTESLTVTNVSGNITITNAVSSVIVRENTVPPSAVFSVTPAGQSVAVNIASGGEYNFCAGGGQFKAGTILGTIVATSAGPFTFVLLESNSPCNNSRARAPSSTSLGTLGPAEISTLSLVSGSNKIDQRFVAAAASLASGGIVDSISEPVPSAVQGSIAWTYSGVTWKLPCKGSITFGNGFGINRTGQQNSIQGCGWSIGGPGGSDTGSILDFSANGSAIDLNTTSSGNYDFNFAVLGSRIASGSSGNGENFVGAGVIFDNVVDHVFVHNSGGQAFTLTNSSRSKVLRSTAAQSYSVGFNMNATIPGVTDDVFQDDTCLDCNINTGLPGNGQFNFLASGGLGYLSGFKAIGNTARNLFYAQTDTITNITNNGSTWTLTLSGSGINVWSGQYLNISGVVCTGSPCYNGIYTAAAGTGALTTSITITNATTPTYSSAGTITWGGASGAFTGGQNANDTAASECFQVLPTIQNGSLIGNSAFHCPSEAFVITGNQQEVADSTVVGAGEECPGCTGITLLGVNLSPLNITGGRGGNGPQSNLHAHHNNIYDAPIGILLAMGQGSINGTESHIDIDHNNVGQSSFGYPQLAQGLALQANFAGPATLNGGSYSCSAGACVVSFTGLGSCGSAAGQQNCDCQVGDVWHVDGVIGGSAPGNLNGDFVLTSVTNATGGANGHDGNGWCTGFHFTNGAVTATGTLSALSVTYPTNWIFDVNIDDNNLGAAATPYKPWAGANVPTGFVNFGTGNTTLAPANNVGQTFRNLAGPDPVSNGASSGFTFHHFTGGHVVPLVGGSAATLFTAGTTAGAQGLNRTSGFVFYSANFWDGTHNCVLTGIISFSLENSAATAVASAINVPASSHRSLARRPIR